MMSFGLSLVKKNKLELKYIIKLCQKKKKLKNQLNNKLIFCILMSLMMILKFMLD